MQASRIVAAQEAGVIINEHYDVEEYVRRRTAFLGKHPDYFHLPRLFPIARRDAGDVFSFEGERLPVQEVRRREQAAGFDLLLPLPTNKNTQSIDYLNSYGAREWSPSVGWPVARPASFYEDQDNLTTPSLPTATISTFVSHTAVQHQSQPQQPALNVAHSPSSNTQTVTPPTSPTLAASQHNHAAVPHMALDPRSSVQTPMTQSANTNQDVPSREQTATVNTTAPSQLPDSDHDRLNTSADPSSPMAESLPTQATSPMAPDHPSDARQQGLTPSIIDNIGTQPSQQHAPTSTPAATAEPTVMPVWPSDPREKEMVRVIIENLGKERTQQHAPASTVPVTELPTTKQQAPPSTPPVTGNASTEDQSPPSASSVRVGNDVAALAGRGMSVPVKQKPGKKTTASASPPVKATDSVMGDELVDEQMSLAGSEAVEQKRGKKRAASEPSDEDAPGSTDGSRSAEQTPEAASRPAKKLKVLKGPRKPVTAPSNKSSPASKSKTKRKTATPSRISSPIDPLEAIIAGTALPTNADEAKQAAETCYQRLLAQQNPTKKATASSRQSRVRRGQDPDLLPEFFNPNAFPKGMMHDQQVRCLCNVVADDNEPMIGCDKCLVWEHRQCIGEALPANFNPDVDPYLCRMCDPWTHRAVIARLRREHALE
ncbi:hypothetical protein LTR85_011440 [Meristemomyces frigidus]|nr:hypothetical protein LTR85_011440 [Meristemomyces frigidus]